MKTQHAIQYLSAPAYRAAGEAVADAAWSFVEEHFGVNYADRAAVEAHAAELEAQDDGAYRYRVVAVASPADCYDDLAAENLDLLEAVEAWLAAGCPRGGAPLAAVERAARERDRHVPVRAA